jgi:hypothetical protein
MESTAETFSYSLASSRLGSPPLPCRQDTTNLPVLIPAQLADVVSARRADSKQLVMGISDAQRQMSTSALGHNSHQVYVKTGELANFHIA